MTASNPIVALARCEHGHRPNQARSPVPLIALAAALTSTAPSTSLAATISEPETVLFGRIVNRAGNAEEFVSQGELAWTFQVPGGGERTFRAALEPLQSGQYSYQLRIPHSVALTGLATAPEALPLTIDEKAYGFAEIRVNGAEASVAGDMAAALGVAQSRRAQAVRVDLVLREPMLDTDGDGIPDWWEELYGLNPDSAADGRGDLDGDGLSNLDEFLAGLSPEEDNRLPALAQTTFTVYPGGRSGLALRVVDSDSAPQDVVLVVTALPAEGELVIRDQSGGRALALDDTFTAADAELGLIEFRRQPGGDPPARVNAGFRLVDTTPAGTAGTVPVDEEVALEFFVSSAVVEMGDGEWRPLADTANKMDGMSAPVEFRSKAALLAEYGDCVVWDLLDSQTGIAIRAVGGAASEDAYLTAFAPLFGPARPLVLLGGSGADRLEGGFGEDVLCGGAGEDDLTGNNGADRFVIDSHAGLDRIRDFDPAEGDQIDLTRVIRGSSALLDDYVRAVSDAAGGTSLQIVPSGVPGEEATVVVGLDGFGATAETLVELVESGALLVGDLSTMPTISVEVAAGAAENGLQAGQFVIRRAGSVLSPLSVVLAVTGSATPGVDYEPLAGVLIFPAGVREMPVDVRPYSDGIDENTETVRLEVLAGTGYRIGSAGAGELEIGDLKPVLDFEVVQSDASFSPFAPASLLLHRSGLVERQIIVRLRWSGTAARAAVEALPELLVLGHGETSRLVEVRPKAGGAVPAAALALSVEVLENASYLLGPQPAARVSVVPESETFTEWLRQHFRDPGPHFLAAFARLDPGSRGIPLVARYAFGLDPDLPDTATAGLPRVVVRNGRPGIEFVQKPGTGGLDLAVESSPDLRSWTGGAGLRDATGVPGSELPPGWRRFESAAPDPAETGYFRVGVRLQD
jgi:hypothetical protein